VNIGIVREREPRDARVAITPPVAAQLAAAGASVWVQSRAGCGAKYSDEDYMRAGAQIAYSAADVIRRSSVLVKIGRPTVDELSQANEATAVFAFYHMAVAGSGIFDALAQRKLTAIGCEIMRSADGRLPVLAPISEVAGLMTVPIAAHLMRSGLGGRGILLGGTPGIPPASIVIVGAGVVGTWAARAAQAAGARVTLFDIDADKLRLTREHISGIATALADSEMIAEAVATADVVIGAVLVAGHRTPHVVTRSMVERMRPGAAIIDVSIDQGGCIETSRPTTLSDPVYTCAEITHYCVPNLTADMGRSASTAIAQGLMPYLLLIARNGIDAALTGCAELRNGLYTYRGAHELV
jgi:alanine dehydrogenase